MTSLYFYKTQLVALFAAVLISNFSFSAVDMNTMDNKVMVGYQGWHWAKGDGSPRNKWNHWSNDKDTRPGSNDCHFDVYPDMSEYTESYNTNFYRDGKRFKVYSTQDYSTVNVHFKWMKEYNIDGAFVQRFIHHFIENNSTKEQNINIVLNHVKNAAQAHGRAYAVMYDVSDVDNDNELINEIKKDWDWLNNNNYLNSSSYLHHDGKPVVAIWGMGLANRRPADPAKALNLINWFKNDRGCHIMGGVPDDWRTFDVGGEPGGTSKSRTEPLWVDVYEAYNVLSPWMVGRIGKPSDSDHWLPRITEDVDKTKTMPTTDYMPVVFPGFSRANWYDNEAVNKYPRLGGQFLWRQAYNAKRAGAGMLYIAMFDEVDEGTCIYKMTETIEDCPDAMQWVTADSDGYDLPGDWYLQVADYINQMFKGEVPAVGELPLLNQFEVPEITVAGAPTGNISNSPYTLTISVDGDYGYYSVNDDPYIQFSEGNPVGILVNAPITLKTYTSNENGTSDVNEDFYDIDMTPPTIGIVSGPSSDYTSATPFDVTLEADENYGYWSLDGSAYQQFGIEDVSVIANGDFENGSSSDAHEWGQSSWHARSNNKSKVGSWALRSTYRGSSGFSSSTTVSVLPNTNYVLSAWIWKDDDNGKAYLDMSDISGEASPAVFNGYGGGEWTYVESSWNSGSRTQVTIRCVQDGGSITGDFYWDDVRLSTPSSTATQVVSIAETSTLRYYAEDGLGNSTSVETVNYTISTNSAPYWLSASFTKEDAQEDVYYSQSLLGDIVDPDNDTLTFSKFSGTASWLNVSPSGILYGTPPIGSSGLGVIVVDASDGESDFVRATISIDIQEAHNPDPYEEWKFNHAVNDDMADYDGDGLVNLIEFAVGGDPRSATSGQNPTVSPGAGSFIFKFRRNEESVTYTIEKSSDLSIWSNHLTIVDDSYGAVGSECTVPILESEMNDSKLFLRLKVER